MSQQSVERRAEPALHENARAQETFRDDVFAGLSAQPKTLPCRWLYDERGSELFEEITRLPEYYPTRTEQSILSASVAEIAARIGPGAEVIEYGSGASVKTRTLLDALTEPALYRPVDISGEFLVDAADELARDYPALSVQPFVGDFLSGGPEAVGGPTQPVLGFFPGSTIGNLSDEEMLDFLTSVRQRLGAGASFLMGADLAKSPDILIPAYADAAGVTSAFNLNILRRINRELDGGFDLSAFRHEARWNDAESRIEMHIVSALRQTVAIADRVFEFSEGESIHTENSRKFSLQKLEEILERSGWRFERRWTDDADWFALVLAKAV